MPLTSWRSTWEATSRRPVVARHAPLVLLATLELVWCVYLGATRSIPRGHDGFQYFYLKYYFFNDFVRNGEVARWLPYLTHGSPGAWWYVVQSGIFDLPAMVLARFLRLNDFFLIFYSLLFVEKLLLLVGTWLLAGNLFRSRAAGFAVTAAVTITSIWYTQVWWNFHALLPLPMMLFLLHRSIVDFEWKWLVGCGLLLYLQTFGQLSYFLPMTVLFLAGYGAMVLTQPAARAALVEKFRFGATGLLALAGVAAAFGLELYWLLQASKEIAFISSQRGANGAVSLDVFMSYGGNTDLRAWNQLFSGITPHLDFTFFAGFLVVGLSIVAFSSGPLNALQKAFAWLTAATMLIAAASPASVFVYYFWPLGRIFRHLALLLPAARFFCIMLAGATLDRLIVEPPPADGRLRRSAAVTILSAGWLVLLLLFASNPVNLQTFLATITTGTLPWLDDYGKLLTPMWLVRGVVFLTLSWAALIALQTRDGSTQRRTRVAWILAVVLLADVWTYSLQEARARMVSLPPREAALFQFTDLPYLERRTENPEATDQNPRRRTFAKAIAATVGTRYWAEDLLWLNDSYQTSQRTVFWSTALDSLLQAVKGRAGLSALGGDEMLTPPLNDPLLTNISGFRESKVRFFSAAIVCPDLPSTAAILADHAYRGQTALVTGSPASVLGLSPQSIAIAPCAISAATPNESSVAASASSRMVSFSSNHAEFIVENPTGGPLVMTYSDSWSPHWRAQIDRKPAPVLRSDLAYKAVIVPAGQSRVAFEYRDQLAEAVVILQGAGNVGFLLFLAWLTGRAIREPRADERTPTAFWFSTT